MRTAGRIPPGSAIGNAGYRLLMGASAALLSPRRDGASRSLGRALRTTALDRLPAPERAWIERIDAVRPDLAVGALSATADTLDRPEAERLDEATAAIRWMSLPPVLGRLLFRIVRELEPRSCLELGTGFGISTSYQAAALEIAGSGRITSLDIEGMVALARPGLVRLELEHRIDLVGGLIEETLGGALAAAGPFDYALLDADHTEAGTLAAFEAILPRLSAGALVVVDDINWTEGMRRAWPMIKQCERVATTISLRRLGVVVLSESGSTR